MTVNEHYLRDRPVRFIRFIDWSDWALPFRLYFHLRKRAHVWDRHGEWLWIGFDVGPIVLLVKWK